MTHPAFEDISVGDELPPLVKGPIQVGHIVRWSAAMENWHRMHYDWRYATEHDGLPDVLVNGSWKQHVLIQHLTDWAGEDGWVWKSKFQFRGMNIPGDTVRAWAKVTGTETRNGYGLVHLDIGMLNQDDKEAAPGTATIVLPLAGGRKVPYPFDPAVVAA